MSFVSVYSLGKKRIFTHEALMIATFRALPVLLKISVLLSAHLCVHLLSECLLSIYSLLGTVLSIGVTKVNEQERYFCCGTYLLAGQPVCSVYTSPPSRLWYKKVGQRGEPSIIRDRGLRTVSSIFLKVLAKYQFLAEAHPGHLIQYCTLLREAPGLTLFLLLFFFFFLSFLSTACYHLVPPNVWHNLLIYQDNWRWSAYFMLEYKLQNLCSLFNNVF